MSHLHRRSSLHQLLWGKLNNEFAATPTNTFLMTEGKSLLHSDYSLTNNNVGAAAEKTFELTDSCTTCTANYNPTGSNIHMLWEQLLYEGKGPEAGPEQKAAFEEAKMVLYKNYEAKTYTPFYQSYLDALAGFKSKAIKMKSQYQQQYGDTWKEHYEEMIKATDEYMKYDKLKDEVAPYEKAIDDWQYGPLADVLTPMKKAYEENKLSVFADGMSKKYLYVEMIPSNWYQWFDQGQPEDSSWTEMIVNEHSKDEHQQELYEKMDSSKKAGNFFLHIRSTTKSTDEKKIEFGSSSDVKLSFKVRSVEIHRPWMDLSVLKIKDWKIPGMSSQAWSTGILNCSNSGSFPILITKMIVAKDITVTAAKFSQEIVDTLRKFDKSVQTGVLFGAFSFGSTSSHVEASHDFIFDSSRNTITVKGSQVIGYIGTLVPKYPA